MNLSLLHPRLPSAVCYCMSTDVRFQPQLCQSRKSIVRLTVMTLLVTAGMWTTRLPAQAAPTFTGCGGETVAATNADFEAEVAELVNLRRAEQNLPPFKLVTTLTNAARYHATDMAQDDYFQHNAYDRVNGNLVQTCEWYERVTVYYPNPRAENIAWGYTTPASVMQGWMDSPGHRTNILSDNREMGVGFANNYWVQDFGTTDDVYPLIINREARQTASPTVALYIYGTWEQMRLRNDDGAWTDWQPFRTESNWTLVGPRGLHTVTVELRSGATTATSSDSIELTTNGSLFPAPAPTAPAPNAATLHGQLALEGRPNPPSPAWVIPLQVTLIGLDAGAPQYTLTPTTNENGLFQVTDITPGAYTLRVHSAHTLWRVLNVTLQPGDNQVEVGTLAEGDAVEDNTVNVLDFSRLTGGYLHCNGSAGYLAQIDFNDDGCVNDQDVALLTKNFGHTGDAGNTSAIVAAGAPQAITLNTGAQHNAGERFTVGLTINGGVNKPIDAGALYLNFDPSRFKAIRVESNNAFDILLTNQIDNGAGHIDLAAGALANPMRPPFTFATITLEALTTINQTDFTISTSGARQTDFAAGGQSLIVDGSHNLQNLLSAQEIAFNHSIFLPVVCRK